MFAVTQGVCELSMRKQSWWFSCIILLQKRYATAATVLLCANLKAKLTLSRKHGME